MSVWAVGFVCIIVATSVNNISHVVGLSSAFKMMWVTASSIVAFVAYHRWDFVGGDVVGEPVHCTVFPCCIELSVAVST
jgi:hypothetical protein